MTTNNSKVISLYSFTRSGAVFNFLNPEAHAYKVSDIAHHLSNICRYGGAAKFHYSVGQHSILMAEAGYAMTGDPILALDCLFHDAAEAYIGDMTAPLKAQIPKFCEIEDRIDRALRIKLREGGIPVPLEQTPECRWLDQAAVLAEWPVLIGHGEVDVWYPGVDPLDATITPWPYPHATRDTFMELTREMTKVAKEDEAERGV